MPVHDLNFKYRIESDDLVFMLTQSIISTRVVGEWKSPMIQYRLIRLRFEEYLRKRIFLEMVIHNIITIHFEQPRVSCWQMGWRIPFIYDDLYYFFIVLSDTGITNPAHWYFNSLI